MEDRADERLRLAAMIWYAETRASGQDRESAQKLIRTLFRKDIAEQVKRDTDDPAAALKREFPALKCFDCEHCAAAGKDCEYPAVRQILVKIARAMKAENVSQEALLEELKILYS